MILRRRIRSHQSLFSISINAGIDVAFGIDGQITDNAAQRPAQMLPGDLLGQTKARSPNSQNKKESHHEFKPVSRNLVMA